MNQYSHSWYRPGNWALPDWWTEGPPTRGGRATREEQEIFYTGAFAICILGHTGGMTRPPRRSP